MLEMYIKTTTFFFFFLTFVCLSVMGRSCHIQEAACGILFSNQGSNSSPLRWELRVPVTGPPGKSLFKKKKKVK